MFTVLLCTVLATDWVLAVYCVLVEYTSTVLTLSSKKGNKQRDVNVLYLTWYNSYLNICPKHYLLCQL